VFARSRPNDTVNFHAQTLCSLETVAQLFISWFCQEPSFTGSRHPRRASGVCVRSATYPCVSASSCSTSTCLFFPHLSLDLKCPPCPFQDSSWSGSSLSFVARCSSGRISHSSPICLSITMDPVRYRHFIIGVYMLVSLSRSGGLCARSNSDLRDASVPPRSAGHRLPCEPPPSRFLLILRRLCFVFERFAGSMILQDHLTLCLLASLSSSMPSL